MTCEAHAPFRFEDCPKDLDVEEPVNFYFHRRLAFYLVIKPIERLGLSWVTPMKLTLASIAVGILAGVVSGFGPEYGPQACVLGGLLLLLHVVLDCSDGMLARLRGQSTRLGMLVDGLGDGIVGVAYWAGLARTTAHLVHGPWVWPALVIILVSIATHTSLYDNLKNKFVAATFRGPSPDAGVRVEQTDFERRAEAAIERIYRVYGGAGGSLVAGDLGGVEPDTARKLLRPSMRSAAQIGLGTSLFWMYLSALCMPLFPLAPLVVGLFGLAGIGNVVMVVALFQWRRGERRLAVLHGRASDPNLELGAGAALLASQTSRRESNA